MKDESVSVRCCHRTFLPVLRSIFLCAACDFTQQAAVGGSDEERALRKKKKKNKEDDRFAAVKSAIIKRLGDTCDVSLQH